MSDFLLQSLLRYLPPAAGPSKRVSVQDSGGEPKPAIDVHCPAIAAAKTDAHQLARTIRAEKGSTVRELDTTKSYKGKSWKL